LLVLIQIAQILLTVLWWIIIVQFILSLLISFNVVNMRNDLVRSLYTGLEKLMAPVYRPIRRVLPDTHPLDLAPMAVLVMIAIMRSAILPAIYRATL
jgi:YggT family protein